MRSVTLTDTLVHEYTEYEWEDLWNKDSTTVQEEREEIKHMGVVAAEAAGMRFFQVLVKPADELLSESKPRSVMVVDTWKYRARIKADHAQISTAWAMMALMARLLGSYKQGNALFIQVPGYKTMAFSLPDIVLDAFEGVPDADPVDLIQFATREDIMEAVFVHDRKHNG